MFYLSTGLFLEEIGEKTTSKDWGFICDTRLALVGFGPSKVPLPKSLVHHFHCVLHEWRLLENIIAHSVNAAPEVVQHGSCGSQALFSSVTQLCPTLCNLMVCSTPGFPVHHQLTEPIQTHVHRVGDAIQLSHLLSSPSPPALNLSQHQDLF